MLKGHPAVADCACIARGRRARQAPRGRLRDPRTRAPRPRPRTLLAFGREHLASYKAPKVVYFAREFPRTRNGKILRREITPGLAIGRSGLSPRARSPSRCFVAAPGWAAAEWTTIARPRSCTVELDPDLSGRKASSRWPTRGHLYRAPAGRRQARPLAAVAAAVARDRLRRRGVDRRWRRGLRGHQRARRDGRANDVAAHGVELAPGAARLARRDRGPPRLRRAVAARDEMMLASARAA